MVHKHICRCCLTQGCSKNLSNSYLYGKKLENYGDMLIKTFNLSLQCADKFICEECIIKIRDAATFKQHILDVEPTFIEKFKESGTIIIEGIKQDIDADAHNHDDSWNDEEYEVPILEIKRETVEEEKNSTFYIDKNPCSTIKCETATIEVECPKSENVNNTKTTPNTDENIKEKDKYTITQLKTTKSKLTEAQKDLCENTFKLISNSNMCLFKSLKTKFACYVCKETFLEIKLLREHSKNHPIDKIWQRVRTLKGMSFLNVDITKLTCNLCTEMTDDNDILKRHLTEKHDIVFGRTSDHLLVPYKIENEFKCIYCDEVFNKFASLSSHMNSHATSNVCEICGTVFYNRNSLRLHIQALHKIRKCTICQQTFTSASKLGQHVIKVHNKIVKRYCKICDMTFQYTYKLENHMIEKHGAKEKTTECSSCGKTLKNPSHLKIHIRSVHLKERNHPCSVCSLRFFTSTDKRRHERSHSDSSNFICSVCQSKFKSKDSLRRHMKRQHAPKLPPS